VVPRFRDRALGLTSLFFMVELNCLKTCPATLSHRTLKITLNTLFSESPGVFIHSPRLADFYSPMPPLVAYAFFAPFKISLRPLPLLVVSPLLVNCEYLVGNLLSGFATLFPARFLDLTLSARVPDCRSRVCSPQGLVFCPPKCGSFSVVFPVT